jgi:hypothetical protein
MRWSDGTRLAPDQRLVATLRGAGLSTLETGAMVVEFGEEGHFDVSLSAPVDETGLRIGAGVGVDFWGNDGMWRLQTRIVRAGPPPNTPGTGRGQTLTLVAVGAPRHVDIRRYRRIRVWTPIRHVTVDAPAGMCEPGWSPEESVVTPLRARLDESASTGRAFNLGAGGLAFVPDAAARVGQCVFLRMEEPRLDIETFGQVVWARRESSAAVHAGVSFSGLVAARRDILLEYVLRGRGGDAQSSRSGPRTPRAATIA